MNHSLDGARLKVVRAQEHLDSLKAEIRMHLDEQPNVVVRSKPDPNLDLHMLSVPPSFPVEDTPLRLSTIVGDCVTNARASIDYVVWELSQKFFVPSFDQSKHHLALSRSREPTTGLGLTTVLAVLRSVAFPQPPLMRSRRCRHTVEGKTRSCGGISS